MEKWLNFLLFFFNIDDALIYVQDPSVAFGCCLLFGRIIVSLAYYLIGTHIIYPSIGAFVGLIIGSIIFLAFVISVIMAICASCTKTAGQRGRVVHPNNGIAVIHSNTNIAGQQMYATPSAPPPYMFSHGGYGMGYHTSSVVMPPPPPSYAALDQTRPPPPPTYSSLNSSIPPPMLPPIQQRNN